MFNAYSLEDPRSVRLVCHYSHLCSVSSHCELAAACAKSLLMLCTFSLIISTYNDYKIIFETSFELLPLSVFTLSICCCVCQHFAAECCNSAYSISLSTEFFVVCIVCSRMFIANADVHFSVSESHY